METFGTLHRKLDTQKVSEKFRQREFIVLTEEYLPHPNPISFFAYQETCELLDQFKEGDKVKIEFELTGREWNGPKGPQYFNKLKATSIKINKS